MSVVFESIKVNIKTSAKENKVITGSNKNHGLMRNAKNY
jgi:hypothetical protein